MSVCSFYIIESNIAEIDQPSLSIDQKYLFDIHNAIFWKLFSLRKMSHSRWLTTANRVLRLNVSLENPDEYFLQTAEFVMKVYTSM